MGIVGIETAFPLLYTGLGETRDRFRWNGSLR